MKRVLSLVLLTSVLISLTACGNGKETLTKPFDASAESSVYDEKLIGENDSLRLEWDDTSKGVALYDLKSNLRWGTTPVSDGAEQVDEFGMPIKRSPKVNSPITISYLDYETNTVIDSTSYSAAVEEGRVRCAKGKNSILVEFYFDAARIMVPVQYILKDDFLQIKIKTEDIQEEKNKIVKISVAPFFCSVENDSDDSYIFVPSGSGTLIKPTTLSQQGTDYSSQVYGFDSTIEVLSETSVRESVRLPVYGARMSDGKGALAIIDGAADSAVIEVSAGASAYGYTTVFSSFLLRGYTGHVANLFSGTNVENTVYSNRKINETLSVRFYPLIGNNADYTGMAETYRNYLIKKYNMTELSDDSSLGLTFLGGTMVSDSFCGIPYTRLYAATTATQVKSILTDVFKETELPVKTVLKGFGSTGIDAGVIGGKYRIAKELGKNKELTELQKLCNDNASELYFDYDIVRFVKSGKGASTFSDACYNAGEKKAAQYLYNVAVLNQDKDTLYYLFTPSKIGDALQRVLKSVKKMNIDGISVSTLTSMCYSDYSDKSKSDYYAKSGFAKNVTDNLKSVKNEKLKIASSAANDYAAALSDVIMNVPTQSDGEHIFYTDIPFYEMVFKGYVSMTSESINLKSDGRKAVLKAVESGCGLNYTVIDNWSNRLFASDVPVFYNSVYSDIKEDICENIALLGDYYNNINGAHISEHKILTETLRMTVFDNGTVVYVNYGNSPADSPAGSVDAVGFLLAKR